MMLRGPRLLLRAVLLLGTASCSAAPDGGWSPETLGYPVYVRAQTPAPAWGAAAGTPAPREEASAGRDGLMMHRHILRAAEVSPADLRADHLRTSTDPNRTGTHPPSVPNRTGTHPLSDPNRTRTHSPSDPSRTWTHSPSEPKAGTHPPSEPNRNGSHSLYEPNRTETHPPFKPNRTGTHPPSEPNRTGTHPPSEPNRTGTHSPSEPNKTVTHPPSEPNGTESPSLSAYIGRTQTVAESGHTEHHLGLNIYYRSEPDGRDISQTSSAAGVTQKSATQRHLNKRTPHMDTTYMSSTRGGDRTLLSVINGSTTSDITAVPNTYATDTGNITAASVSAAWGDGTERNMSVQTAASVSAARGDGTERNMSVQTAASVSAARGDGTERNMSVQTAASVSAAWGDGNSTERNMSVQTADSVPSRYTLPTPPYVVTTYPPSTSHHMPSPTITVTSVPSTRRGPAIDLWFSSSSALPSAATSAAPGGASTRSQQPPSSPISTLPPNTDPSETFHPSTVISSTPGSLAPSTTLPPSLRTESTPGPEKTPTSSVSPSNDVATTNYTLAISLKTPQVVTERRSHDKTTQEVTTTVKATGTETEAMSSERTQGVTAGTALMGTPTLPGGNASSTTAPNIPPTPSQRNVTQEMSHDTKGTTLTTTDPEVMTWTPQMHPNTQAPGPSTTVSPPPSTTPAVRNSGTTVPTPAPPRNPPTAVSLCAPGPCHNGGLCVESSGRTSFRCECQVGWRDDLCSTDVDECLSSPCPALSTCLNSRGSFSCQCPLGYLLETGAGCVLVRTFLGHVEIPWSFLGGTDVKDSGLHQITEDIARILNASFSAISGYYQSTVTSDSSTGRNDFFLQNLFSLESNVTMFDLLRSLQSFAKECESSLQPPRSCQLVLHLQHRLRALSLCHVRNPGCDNATAVCADPAGVAFCQCKPGYFKYSKPDHSCRACDDGYKLENGICVRCFFGLGGFNCSNPYQLITVIMAAAGGGLLLVLAVALAVTCCRKSKHDISKLIFKSGDFQMSPYAEYPKTQRSSEWGRETIEMQENGSTKNLLQMTDIYYSPGPRSSELERNGLHPYSGLPGSRHSCIYPGQYNPSFINEDNRRRDYF